MLTCDSPELDTLSNTLILFNLQRKEEIQKLPTYFRAWCVWLFPEIRYTV